MLDKALGAVKKYNMLSPGAAVIAAVSGGADSMAMLLFLMKIRERYSLSLTVAHVNHGLRGEEARRDENYVRSFCEKNGLRFEVLHADVAALAKQRGESCEECGRRVRYEFFESIDKNAKIATAHTASDNAETMLFNLARGSSLKGLCGIPPVRGNIIRPLIFCTREEIEAFCRENSLDFVTDSTNLTLDYSRNKIRRIAVPALKEINSAFEENASHFSQNAALDEDFLEGETKALLLSAQADGGLSCEALLSAHPRGLTSVRQFAVHPLASVEYVLVPLLLRILQIADQLAVSAVARGAECPGVRKSYYETTMHMRDWCFLALWGIVTAAVLCVGGVKI